jgi:methionine-gamma-lyase
MQDKKKSKGFGTKCNHDFAHTLVNPSHILPIYPSSSFTFDNLEDCISVFQSEKTGHVYSRYGNPTVDAVAQKIASLEQTDNITEVWGYMTSSGMSAIFVLLQSLLKPGDAILGPFQLYGGSTELFSKTFHRQQIELILTDFNDLNQIEDQLRLNKNIRIIYFETPTNPTLFCFDISIIVKIAHKYDVKVVVDNTFSTPYLQTPFLFDVDYIIHSSTKYLNGHGNGLSGIILGHSNDSHKELIVQNLKLIGAICSPFEAWLVYNGLKTLELRLQRQSDNALNIANHFLNHPKIENIFYPGLPSHSTHQIAVKQMSRGFGGMLSFSLRTKHLDNVIQFINSLKIATQAPTLGDTDTLVLHPDTSSHLRVDPKQKRKEKVDENLVRFSIGIENCEDLIEDIEQALSKVIISKNK